MTNVRYFKNLNTGVVWDVGDDEHADYLAKDKTNYEEVDAKAFKAQSKTESGKE